MSDCPEHQVQEINVGVQNLNIANCEEGHDLFLFKKDEDLAIVQDKERGEKGVQGVASMYHLYIDTCASYVSTPYCELLENMEVQKMRPCGTQQCGVVWDGHCRRHGGHQADVAQ